MKLSETYSLPEDVEEISVEKWLEIFEQKYKIAEEIAKDIGVVIIGRVSPFEEVKVGFESTNVNLIVELDKYLEKKDFIARPNTILAAVDITTLHVVSLRVTGVVRKDLYSRLGGEVGALVPYPYRPDLRGLLSRPQIIVEPILEFEYDRKTRTLKSGKSANLVIEPRSPVVLPKPELIETLLDVPSGMNTVPIGALTIGEEPYVVENSIAILRVPLETFFSHIFIVGTTGSGKTTFVKNIIKALLEKNVAIICIDENGDYVQAVLDPIWHTHSEEERKREDLIANIYGNKGGLTSVTVLLPLSRLFIERHVMEIKNLRDLAKIYYKEYLEPQFKQLYTNLKVDFVEHRQLNNVAFINISFTNEKGEQTQRLIKIIPYSLEFSKIHEKIAHIYPYFTERAQEGLINLIRKIKNFSKIKQKSEIIESEILRGKGKWEQFKVTDISLQNFESFVETLLRMYNTDKKALANWIGVHESTLGNMMNGLRSLNEMGIFDIKIGDQKIPEPEIDENIIAGGKLIVFDLRVLDDLAAKRILTFRFLNNILEWKYNNLEPPVIVLVDEAHRFFPKTAAEGEREYVRYVSSVLERIARLGRVRRLGLMISTHSPKDVHDVVLNLCNSKVIFRLDPAVIDALDLPREYKDFVTKAGDRVGLFKSYALRLHYATFRTSLPVIGHFKERV